MKILTETERRAFGSRLREVFGYEDESDDYSEMDAVERTWRWADENPERAKSNNNNEKEQE